MSLPTTTLMFITITITVDCCILTALLSACFRYSCWHSSHQKKKGEYCHSPFIYLTSLFATPEFYQYGLSTYHVHVLGLPRTWSHHHKYHRQIPSYLNERSTLQVIENNSLQLVYWRKNSIILLGALVLKALLALTCFGIDLITASDLLLASDST